jgi:hypothetical protein
MNPDECQFPSLQSIAEGNAQTPPQSLLVQLKLFIRRHLSPGQERILKRQANAIIDCAVNLRGKNSPSAKPVTEVQTVPLKAGDLVRVRSKEEIETTLNHLRQTKGCTFMHEMLPYCGTVQRVLKPMERFVDERDLRVKKCKGLILLEGVMCQGTTGSGRCDRSCHVFWREEWLDRVHKKSYVSVLPKHAAVLKDSDIYGEEQSGITFWD